MFRLILSLLFALALSSISFAGWKGPETVVSGAWGSDDLKFGLDSNQYGLVGGELIGIGKDGLIVVGDGVNRRIKIYSQGGRWLRNIKPQDVKLSPLGGWPENIRVSCDGILTLRRKFQKYSFDGNLIFSIDQNGFKDYWFDRYGEIYLQVENKKYYEYSSDGELIMVHDQRPIKIGIKTSDRRAATENKYDTTVQFDDITYHMILDGDWDDYVRDQNDNLYFYNSYTERDLVSGEPSSTSMVVKYDSFGKFVGQLNLPISEYEKPTQAELDMPTTRLRVRNEYGPPVIGPDGSVYCWKRTPDTYSILKWTWADEPGDPKSECKK